MAFPGSLPSRLQLFLDCLACSTTRSPEGTRHSYLEKRFATSKQQQRSPIQRSTTERDPFLRHQSAFCATILASDELTRLGQLAIAMILVGIGLGVISITFGK